MCTFVQEAYEYTKSDKRKTVKMKDLESVVREVEMYDFLLTDESIMLRDQGKDNADSGGKKMKLENGEASGEGAEHGFWLPLSNIRRIARAHLETKAQPGVKVSLEGTVVSGVSRAATVFVSVLTACALDTCGKRTTLMADNVCYDSFAKACSFQVNQCT